MTARSSPSIARVPSLAGLVGVVLLTLLTRAPTAPPRAAAEADGVRGGLVTLHAKDDLACAFDFRNGVHGARVEDGQVVLESAQLVYDALAPEQLTIGFVRQELVRAIDLGPLYVPAHERAQDPASEYAVSAFHSLHMAGSRFVHLDGKGRTDRLPEANRLLDPMVDDDVRSFEPQVGHVYLIRFQGLRRGSTDEVAKFQVVDVEPGRWVTLRWAPLGVL